MPGAGIPLGILVVKPFIIDQMNSFIDQTIPSPAAAATVREFVLERAQEFRLYKNVTGLVGIVGLFVAASGLFGSMRSVLNISFQIDQEQSIFLAKLQDVGLVLLVLLYFLFAATLVPAMEIVSTTVLRSNILGEFGTEIISDSILKGGSFLIVVLAFLLMYSFVPGKRMSWPVVAVSAVSTAVLWQLAQAIFGFYISHAFTLKRIYGAYVLGIASVFWIYASSIVFIVGAEVGQLYRERLKIPEAAATG